MGTQKRTAAQKIASAETVLVVLGKKAGADSFAAAAALHLTMRAQGKNSTIVAAQLPTVELSAIRGIDQVSTKLPTPNLIVTLEDAVGAVEKVSYFVEGTQLKLVVHPQPNARQFDPSNIHISPGSSQANLTVFFSTTSEDDLDPLYRDEQLPDEEKRLAIASGRGTLAAGTTVVDPDRASDSELVGHLIEELGWPEDESTASDIAYNLLFGVRSGTRDFTDPRVSAETFEVAAQLARRVHGIAGQWAAPVAAIPEVLRQAQHAAAQEEEQKTQPVEPEPDWLTPKIYKGTSLL